MAVTTSVFKEAANPGLMTLTDVQCDSSYESEGEKLTALQLGLQHVDFAICQIRIGPESEEFVSEAWYSPAQEKLHLLNAKTGKEVEAGKNMSKVNVRVIAFGKARAR